MYKNCNWLSEPLDIIEPVNEDDINKMYTQYTSELRDSEYTFRGKVVKYRSNPKIHGKDEGFFHIIAGYKCRPVDIIRARRLLWGKEIILNDNCHNLVSKNCCEGIWIWKSSKNEDGIERVYLFHPKVNYLVIIQEKEDCWLYITSYKVTNSYRRSQFKLEYKKNKWL